MTQNLYLFNVLLGTSLVPPEQWPAGCTAISAGRLTAGSSILADSEDLSWATLRDPFLEVADHGLPNLHDIFMRLSLIEETSKHSGDAQVFFQCGALHSHLFGTT